MNISFLKYPFLLVSLLAFGTSCAPDGSTKSDVSIASTDLVETASKVVEDVKEDLTEVADTKKSDELLEIFVSPEEAEKEKKDKALESIERKKEEKRKADRDRRRRRKAKAEAEAEAAAEAAQKREEPRVAKVETKAPPKPTPVVDEYEEPELKKTKIAFDKSEYDYGMIMQGDKVDYKFTFRNSGNEDLVIQDVSASCGCTKPSYPFIPIAPGEKGYIGVSFDSKGKLGRQQPTVTVVSNAGTSKLKLVGFVDAERAGQPKADAAPINIIDDSEMKKLTKEAIDSAKGEGGGE